MLQRCDLTSGIGLCTKARTVHDHMHTNELLSSSRHVVDSRHIIFTTADRYKKTHLSDFLFMIGKGGVRAAISLAEQKMHGRSLESGYLTSNHHIYWPLVSPMIIRTALADLQHV